MNDIEFITYMMKLLKVLNNEEDADKRCQEACRFISDLIIDFVQMPCEGVPQLVVDGGQA